MYSLNSSPGLSDVVVKYKLFYLFQIIYYVKIKKYKIYNYIIVRT